MSWTTSTLLLLKMISKKTMAKKRGHSFDPCRFFKSVWYIQFYSIHSMAFSTYNSRNFIKLSERSFPVHPKIIEIFFVAYKKSRNKRPWERGCCHSKTLKNWLFGHLNITYYFLTTTSFNRCYWGLGKCNAFWSIARRWDLNVFWNEPIWHGIGNSQNFMLRKKPIFVQWVCVLTIN